MTVRVDFRIRTASTSDQRLLTNLIHYSPYVHRHLDWRSPLDWIGASPFLVAEYQGEPVAALACPPDPPEVYWIRLFAVGERVPVKEVWHMLWAGALGELPAGSQTIACAIVLQDWLKDLLVESSFSSRQEIVMLERDQKPVPPAASVSGYSLRSMLPSDLPAVAHLDAEAFEPVWQNSLEALKRAFPQAVLASVAEDAQGVIGYQLSTRNPFGAHLARLAVRPGNQRRGIGRALVEDLIRQLAGRGIQRLTVNTQSDNHTSLSLYARTGFVETGERYPVYECRIK